MSDIPYRINPAPSIDRMQRKIEMLQDELSTLKRIKSFRSKVIHALHTILLILAATAILAVIFVVAARLDNDSEAFSFLQQEASVYRAAEWWAANEKGILAGDKEHLVICSAEGGLLQDGNGGRFYHCEVHVEKSWTRDIICSAEKCVGE